MRIVGSVCQDVPNQFAVISSLTFLPGGSTVQYSHAWNKIVLLSTVYNRALTERLTCSTDENKYG